MKQQMNGLERVALSVLCERNQHKVNTVVVMLNHDLHIALNDNSMCRFYSVVDTTIESFSQCDALINNT